MLEYLNNGLRLGWLIVLHFQWVETYSPDRAVERLQSSQ